jgi:uncharacterized protein
MRIIRNHECKVVPWRNGAGTTTEIICVPTGIDVFDWRVSVADVSAGGPFSRFEGYDRHIAVIEGKHGMELRFADGRHERLNSIGPFTFSGDDHVEGVLPHGPVRDLNLIIRRGFGRGEVKFNEISEGPFRGNAGPHHLVIYIVRGSCSSGRDPLSAGDALHLLPFQQVALAGTAMLAVCTVVAG